MEQHSANNTLVHKFESSDNKFILWRLMMDNDMFSELPQKGFALIKDEFEKTIRQLKTYVKSGDTLVELNKKVIREMVLFISKQKTAQAQTTAVEIDELPSHGMKQIYNAADITEQRQKVFNNQLQTKQKEFEKLISTKTPDTIDFSDQTIDTPIGSEMDKMLSAAIAFREKQLNLVMETQPQDKKKVNEWLNKSEPAQTQAQAPAAQAAQAAPAQAPAAQAPAQAAKQNLSNIHLKIGDSVPLNDREVINANANATANANANNANALRPTPIHNKRVSFQEDTYNNNNNNNKDTIMINMLQEIMYKQNQILEILSYHK